MFRASHAKSSIAGMTSQLLLKLGDQPQKLTNELVPSLGVGNPPTRLAVGQAGGRSQNKNPDQNQNDDNVFFHNGIILHPLTVIHNQ